MSMSQPQNHPSFAHQPLINSVFNQSNPPNNTNQIMSQNTPQNNNIPSHQNNIQRRQSIPQQHHQQQPPQQSVAQARLYSHTRSKSVVLQSTSINKNGTPIVDFLIGGTSFTVHQKYKLLRAIGHGAYGFVCSAQNTQTNEFVAIKKITNLFNNPIETKRAIREVQLLRKLRHENVLGLVDLMMNDARTDLYLVSELMDSDLHQIIVSKQNLSNDHIQYFIYQILRGLLFIHSANVIHRDLKPSNILVNSNCDIKICDFGLARPVDAETQDHKAFMTEYVATRWYRAPEIMLSWKQYSFAIDIWATGCILAELLGRMPLFPGKDYMDQLKRTLNYIGKPIGDEITHIRTERAKQWVRNFPPTPRVDWKYLYPNAEPKALELLDKMLQFSPSKRITVEQALKHKYLTQLHDASDEPIANFKFDMKFEKEFKDNTVEVDKSKIVLEKELNWFKEFQTQRTNYLITQQKNNNNKNNNNKSHLIQQQKQQQMIRQQQQQQHIIRQQQQQHMMRNRSQSYPLLPSYQQAQQQQFMHNQYLQQQQHLQFLQQQQQQPQYHPQMQPQYQQMHHSQNMQNMQNVAMQQQLQQQNNSNNNNNNNGNRQLTHSQSMNLD